MYTYIYIYMYIYKPASAIKDFPAIKQRAFEYIPSTFRSTTHVVADEHIRAVVCMRVCDFVDVSQKEHARKGKKKPARQ